MPETSPSYFEVNRDDLLQFIVDHFGVSDFDELCLKLDSKLNTKFFNEYAGSGRKLTNLAANLIADCENLGIYGELLMQIRDARPAQYEERFSSVYEKIAPQSKKTKRSNVKHRNERWSRSEKIGASTIIIGAIVAILVAIFSEQLRGLGNRLLAPIPTSTPLPFQPAKPGESLIVIARLKMMIKI